jgi:DNA-binding protein HU-beta
MNKPALIKRIAKDNDCTQTEARRALDYVTNSIGKAMQQGEEIAISGFGSFRIIECAAKKYRHPVTGRMEEMPACSKVKFTPSTKIAEAIK